jgi:membrane-associated phospholipid phosphatase
LADLGTLRGGQSLNTLSAALLTIYLLFILGIMMLQHSSITPDVYAVFALAVAALLGRGRAFIREWLPFIAILLAWQAMRGFAWEIGFPVQSHAIIVVERLLAFGVIPSEFLQSVLHVAGNVNLIDISMSVVYLFHFFGTLTIAFVLWLLDRRLFSRFAAALLVLSFAQFITAIFVPVAPPRFAFMFGDDLAVTDITTQTSSAVGLRTLTWAYTHMNANPFAAFPSLHAAYPVLAALVVRERWPRAGLAIAIYGAVVWFAIIYLGHHYVVDALGGALYAVFSYRAVKRVMDGRSKAFLSLPSWVPRGAQLVPERSHDLTRSHDDQFG